MLNGKIILYLSYVLFGIFIAFIYPWRRHFFIQNEQLDTLFDNQSKIWNKDWFLMLGIGIAITTSFLIPIHFVLISLAIAWFLTCQNRQWRTSGVSIFIGLTASSFLAFWLHDDHNRLKLLPFQSVQFFCITLLAYLFLAKVNNDSINKIGHHIYKILIYCLFITLAFYFSFDIQINLSIDSFYQWHHWSAYLGQAQLVASGAIPLNDIPVQYGVGPILLSALGCKFDCWLSFYWISAGSSFLLTLAVGFLSVKLSKATSNSQISIVLIVALLASLFWPPYQNEILSITTFPSITGLRFLPSLLLLCIIFMCAQSPRHELSLKRPSFYLLNLAWGFCVVWSPDAGIQASVVWFSFFFWSKILQKSQTLSKFLAIRTILELAISCTTVLCLIALLFRYYFNEWPNLANYLIYLHSLPGAPEKVNSNGLIWFAITVGTLWICFTRSTNAVRSDKLVWLSALLAFANFTYFLSHSHDSVMADLIPYFALVIWGVYGAAPSSSFRNITSILLAAIIGWSSLMVGWPKIFNAAVVNSQASLATFLTQSPKKLILKFNLAKSDPFAVIPRSHYVTLKSINLSNSLKYLYDQSSDSVEIFDQWLLIDSGASSEPWNVTHGPVTILPLPKNQQKYFLDRFSKKFPRSGWILYDKDFPIKDVLNLFDSAYTRTQEVDFQYYRAVHYSPK